MENLPRGWLRDVMDAALSGRHGWGVQADGVVWSIGRDRAGAIAGAVDLGAPAAGIPNDPRAAYPLSPALAAAIEVGRPDCHLSDGVLWAIDEETADATAAAFADRVAATAKIPAPSEPWASERRRMVREMALAYLEGSDRVGLSSYGQVNWTASAPMRAEGAHVQPLQQLAQQRRTAAQEIAENLGDRRFLEAIDREATQRRSEKRARLVAVGEALHGPDWVSPLARAAGIELRTMQRWAAGSHEANLAFLPELRAAADQRRAQLQRWIATLDGI